MHTSTTRRLLTTVLTRPALPNLWLQSFGRRELKTRSRFQSNLPTGAASVVSLLAFGMHTGLACAVLGKLFRDSADEILGLFFSSNFFFKVDFFFSCTENKIFCTNFNF